MSPSVIIISVRLICGQLSTALVNVMTRKSPLKLLGPLVNVSMYEKLRTFSSQSCTFHSYFCRLLEIVVSAARTKPSAVNPEVAESSLFQETSRTNILSVLTQDIRSNAPLCPVPGVLSAIRLSRKSRRPTAEKVSAVYPESIAVTRSGRFTRLHTNMP